MSHACVATEKSRNRGITCADCRALPHCFRLCIKKDVVCIKYAAGNTYPLSSSSIPHNRPFEWQPKYQQILLQNLRTHFLNSICAMGAAIRSFEIFGELIVAPVIRKDLFCVRAQFSSNSGSTGFSVYSNTRHPCIVRNWCAYGECMRGVYLPSFECKMKHTINAHITVLPLYATSNKLYIYRCMYCMPKWLRLRRTAKKKKKPQQQYKQ